MRAAEFIESWFDAWNRHDPKAVADHLTRGGIYLDVPENTRRTHDELIDSLGDFFSRFDHRYELAGKLLCADNTVALQYRIYAGTSSACGSTYSGAEFITLSGDAAVTITDYYDLPGISPSGSPNGCRRQKYAKSGLSPERMREYQRRLEVIMRSQQAYLEPGLSLPRLAELVDCSVNHLSQVLNAGLGMSFFEYLNRHRIRHAQSLLRKLGQEHDAMLNVAFAVGFNSNSAFYSAFKRITGNTPAQYRRTQQNKAH